MTHNPARGCGKKKKGSFYIEGKSAPGGILSLWTHVLDDGGVDEGNILYWQPPPRQSLEFRPLESIALREIYPMTEPKLPGDCPNEDFQRLLKRVPQYGIVDHVGENNYSAHSFAREVMDHGPSRRVSKQFAFKVGNMIQEHGACPVFFTHSRIPAFRTEGLREVAWELAQNCSDQADLLSVSPNFTPTWRGEEWGMYAYHTNGWSSSMVNVLSLVDRLEKHWRDIKSHPAFEEAKHFFEKLDYVERPFGATWINHVTYTLPEDGEVDPDADNIPGLRYLDLDEDEIVGYSAVDMMEGD